MEKNSKLEILETYIGKTISDFGSPLTRWLAPEVLKVEPGHLEFSYIVREDMLNSISSLHGGISAAIIDDIIGFTMVTVKGESGFYVTVNNVIDYFAPAFLGTKIVASTSLIKKGKQLSHVQCELWNDTRTRLLVRGISNMMFVPKKD
ncbi:PaaI family thioesterase [Olivibacter sitiensis]|uniref:PaaI family thioesterase n=1 Tax=Olivibacter sitiensis TaxID=376470 RepID=UPI00041D9997|nr:PaaI family thioesterase [Olivibacter sitiensis]